ncbi:MAG: 30S ribosomal protein S8 [Parcubacteria group bacterium GW2011_GWB1_43_6]|nr:MAG: 30S ribosomal protein S8 [Parcubacteria group bacterium GW2011_GWB1_43_6]
MLLPQVEVDFSNLKYEIAKILARKGFIDKAVKAGKGAAGKTLEIVLKYDNKVPAISGIKRVSKPGQRIYLPAQKIKSVRGGYGFSIISTSKGLMTGSEAKKQNLGGEIICEIW